MRKRGQVTLHRLTGAGFISGPYAGQYGCWSYDSFGNRTAEALSTTPCGSSPTPNTWAAYASGTNRITSGSSTFNYSAAGNVKYDGLNTYLYDNEGRVCAVQNAATSVYQYLYDANGNRIAKASANALSCAPSARTGLVTQYLLGPGGEDVTELSGSNAWNYSNIYAGEKLLGTYSGSNTYFSMTDWLGTKRAEATANGVNCGTYSSLPFGNAQSISGSCDPSEQHFTGKERDTESGLDYFGARYYASSFGRWLVPDWSSLPDAVPYAALSNSQTLNLYAYVTNNPLRLTDPDGHHHQVCGSQTSSTNPVTGAVTVSVSCKDANDWWDFVGPRKWLGGHPKTVKTVGFVAMGVTAVSGVFDGGASELALPEELAAEEGLLAAGEEGGEGLLAASEEGADLGIDLSTKPTAESPELQRILDELYKP